MRNIKNILDHPVIISVFVVLLFCIIYNPFTSFPFTFLLISMLVLVHQYLQNGNLAELNFKHLKIKDLFIVLAAFMGIELFMDFIAQPLITKALHQKADYSDFSILQGNTELYFKYVCFTWMSAALGEELFFRAFIFSQLKNLIGNRSHLIIFISSLLFCIPHIYLDATGLISTFFFGILFGYLYYLYKNIWINIIVHGLVDTFFLTLCYLNKVSYYELTNQMLIGY